MNSKTFDLLIINGINASCLLLNSSFNYITEKAGLSANDILIYLGIGLTGIRILQAMFPGLSIKSFKKEDGKKEIQGN